ncbi:hypothetical protein [Curtobacterium flaccumfaciens]|uniref:hypothetical protein n=1 Tax=Curtobacterium flaccumfaciens TaxID=2035 RepID=UPI001E3733B3|nr:hypothetical protein [Curtobacterium allii]MCE0459679.1 hypothetical protein [Curtobacterium allii]
MTQANIRRVIVNGTEVDREFDLNHQEQFLVETDTGNKYRVVCDGPAVGTPSDWDVLGDADSVPVGRVHLLGAGSPGATTYRLKRAKAWFAGGKQMDLWNAVQSLLD